MNKPLFPNLYPLYFMWLILLGWALPAAAQTESVVTWAADRPLQWSDYRGTPPPDVESYEAVNMVYKMAISYTTYDSGTVFRCVVQVMPQFVQNQSWIISDKIKPELLTFERLRFDLVELHARKLRKQYAGIVFNKNDFKKQIQQPHREQMQALDAALQQLDDQTFYGTRKAETDAWQKRIWDELTALSAFAK